MIFDGLYNAFHAAWAIIMNFLPSMQLNLPAGDMAALRAANFLLPLAELINVFALLVGYAVATLIWMVGWRIVNVIRGSGA